jgi:hypothetical protein
MKGKSYMGHETTPLFETKVPEGKLVTKFVNNRFNHSSGQKPPATNNYILNVTFL